MDKHVVSINISEKKGTKKFPVDNATLKIDHGIVGDAHANNWHRQISLLANESVKKMNEDNGMDLTPGCFGENITTEGIDLKTLPLGTVIKIGDIVELEVTQIGKECHDRCHIYYEAGDCIMPKEGIFVKVLKDGDIAKGDKMDVINS